MMHPVSNAGSRSSANTIRVPFLISVLLRHRRQGQDPVTDKISIPIKRGDNVEQMRNKRPPGSRGAGPVAGKCAARPSSSPSPLAGEGRGEGDGATEGTDSSARSSGPG
ncbi:hypothetical protein GMST_29210 [Geomonas silvestris]|uniref:Uncharacterized protein n=1 Tax=Geomonas silvestris TaxID=2740184 RepID=A0A6V8MKS9_9BACT|nr:hypothetical protein GMST_29210 [Geomonas silvestris]